MTGGSHQGHDAMAAEYDDTGNVMSQLWVLVLKLVGIFALGWLLGEHQQRLWLEEDRLWLGRTLDGMGEARAAAGAGTSDRARQKIRRLRGQLDHTLDRQREDYLQKNRQLAALLDELGARPAGEPRAPRTTAQLRQRWGALWSRLERHLRHAVRLSFGHRALRFATGRAVADLVDPGNAATVAALGRRADALVRRGLNVVQVEGHTDNVPIHNQRFADNMALSFARARWVAALLQRRLRAGGLRRGEHFLVVAVGFGQTFPLRPHALDRQGRPAGDAQNRRIVLRFFHRQLDRELRLDRKAAGLPGRLEE